MAKTTVSNNSDNSLKIILSLIKGTTQVDLSHYKMSTIRRRVERQMRMKKLPTITKYASFLKSHPDALIELYEDVFVHVTEFFRDPEAYESLKKTVFPSLVKGKNSGDSIRMWIAGCSSGEEAFSLAIAFTEFLKSKKLDLKLTVFATDISGTIIQFARRAQYGEESIEKIKSKKILAYFEKQKEFYCVKKEIRDLVVFSQHDLISSPPFSKLDFISCRNVLIYFGQELQKKILPTFHFGLNKDGFLWLGPSETTNASAGSFETIDKRFRIYKKIPVKLKSGKRDHVLRIPVLIGSPVDSEANLQRTADQLLLTRYAPRGVIVNAQNEVLHFRGKTSPYLSQPSGNPTNSLFKMAHPDLAPYLKKLILEVNRKKTPVRKDGIIVHTGKKSSKVNIEISALDSNHMLILFSESETKTVPVEKILKKKAIPKGGLSDQELIKQLQVQRDYLQAVFEQYESTQEELMSANEELQAANEELHGANEEMDTAREELQCTNEELTTTNEELEARNQDLINLNDKLARSEERFRLMVTSVRDYAIFMLDPEGNIASWNDGAKRFKGYEADEVIGHHFSMFYTESDRARLHPEQELKVAIADGRYEEEGWRVRKDGTRFWANVILTRINDSKGNLLGFSKVTRDLTERRKAETLIKQSEERFRLMVSAVKDYAIFMLDPNGNIASWNEGAKRFKGYTAKEIIGKHFSTFYTESDKEKDHPAFELKRAYEDGRYEEEGWRIRKDGTRFWANVVITRMDDPSGKYIGFVKVTRDLTEKRNTEEELRRSEERLRLMVSAVKDYAILMLDKAGNISSWNEGATRINGWQANEVIGKNISLFYTKEDNERHHPQYELRIAASEGRYEEEGWRVRKDKTLFWANVVVSRINDSSGNHIGFVKVTRDLTDKKRAEESLKSAYGDLEQRVQERTSDLENALKSRDEFLSIASHELKTPLTSLRLQLQLSSRRIERSESKEPLLNELAKSLDIGVRQVTSLTHLVNDLLDISRIQTGNFELNKTNFNLSELVDEITSRFKEQFEQSRSHLELHIDPDLSGSWDRFRLEQVIVNLLSNAIKYAPQTTIMVITRKENNQAYLEVIDHGPGVDAEKIDKIFNRFERGNAASNVGGLGLGLFITRKIVEHHGGNISVESAPGKGARFIVELPLQ